VGQWLWDQHKHRDETCEVSLQTTLAMPLEGSPGFGDGIGCIGDGSIANSSPLVSSEPFKVLQSLKVGELSFVQRTFLSSTGYWFASIFSMNVPYKLWFQKQTCTLELVFHKVYGGVRLADGTGPEPEPTVPRVDEAAQKY
jgi:hypothetical protein